MDTSPPPTAVIAEDEPVLARTLTRLLAHVWPELRIVASPTTACVRPSWHWRGCPT